MNRQAARSDRAHADGAEGVERRQFVEGAMGLQEVALGADFACLAQGIASEETVLGCVAGIANREGPRQAPALTVFFKDDGRRISGDDAGWDRRIFRDVVGDLGVGLFDELEVSGEFISHVDFSLVSRECRRQDG